MIMRISLRRSLLILLVAMATTAVAGRANAHYLWLKSDANDGQPQAGLIFGEGASDEAYHLPESLADTTIYCRTANGDRRELTTEKVDNDDRIGLVAPLLAD